MYIYVKSVKNIRYLKRQVFLPLPPIQVTASSK